MDPSTEMEGKKLHDPIIFQETKKTTAATPFKSPVRRMWVPGPVIVGAGPSGLAVAACLKHQPGSLRSLILEKENCVASLWQLKTYDRLRLHLPKQFCELPYLPFPGRFPTYPTRDQFVEYLEDYAAKFDLEVAFNRTVRSAEFDPKCGVWVVKASVAGVSNAAGAAAEEETEEYWCRWVVAATGENAVAAVPEIEGMAGFGGPIVHTCEYRSGEEYRGKRVLVVGCGNSGMEISLDLCHFNASPFLVVRDSVHVLPQEMVGRSTFAVAMWMLKWLPVGVVDLVLLAVSHLMLGDTGRLGLHRPKLGPLQLKNASGKTPVLDVGTLAMINSGHIQVRPGIKRLTCRRAEFTDGRVENFDAIVLATGYKSNVQSWLKESEMFSKEDGLPRKPFPNGWKGEHGLYAVGFTNRGLLGASMDARRIAEDIAQCLKLEPTLYFMPLPCTQPSHSIL